MSPFDIRESILKEHTKSQAMKIVRWIGDDQEKFDELVDIFLDGEYRVTQRAAWPLSICVIDHPELVKKHLKKLLLNMEKKNLHDAVTRNILRLLQFIHIPSSLQGLAADICFDLMNNKKQPIAIQVFSMTVLSNLCIDHPELSKELRLSIESKLPYGSAGFRSRANKVLKKLK